MPGPIRKRVGSVQRQRLLPNVAERHPGAHIRRSAPWWLQRHPLERSYLSPARITVMHHPDGDRAARGLSGLLQQRRQRQEITVILPQASEEYGWPISHVLYTCWSSCRRTIKARTNSIRTNLLTAICSRPTVTPAAASSVTTISRSERQNFWSSGDAALLSGG